MLKLACSTVSCDQFSDNNFAKTFEILPKTKFRNVEFNCWHPSDLTPENVRSIKERCEKLGLTPISVYGVFFGGNNSHELSKDVCHKIRMIEAACELGCRRIVATGGPRGRAGGIEGIITVLKEIVPFAEEKGVLICLENHAQNNLENLEDYDRVFNSISSSNVGLCVDTGHFDAANVELDSVIEKFHSRINHIHVKEAIQKGVTEFVRFGEGVTDNNRFIEKALEYGYSGYVSVELAIEDKSNIIHDLEVAYNMFSKYER